MPHWAAAKAAGNSLQGQSRHSICLIMKVFSQFSTPAVSRQHLRLTGDLFLRVFCVLLFVCVFVAIAV